MGVEWVMYLQSQIFTRIKNEFSEKLKKDYGMTGLNFSTEQKKQTNPIFPFVRIQALEPIPNGEDLERCAINGLKNYTLQIDVTDNQQDSKRAKRVVYEVLRVMVKMHFTCRGPYTSDNTTDETRLILRCSRNIDEGDIL